MKRKDRHALIVTLRATVGALAVLTLVGLEAAPPAGSPTRPLQLELRAGTAWGRLSPVVSQVDAFVVPLLGIDRRFGGHREPVAHTVVEDSVRCPGMNLLGCEGPPILFQALVRHERMTYLFAMTRRPRTRFYTQVTTVPQSGWELSGEYTQYSYHTDRNQAGARYALAGPEDLRLSLGLLLERRLTRYNLNQHTAYVADPSADTAIFIGRFLTDDREWGLRPLLRLDAKLHSRWSVFAEVGLLTMRGVSNFSGASVMLAAPDSVLTQLGAARASWAEAGRSEYHSRGSVLRIGFAWRAFKNGGFHIEHSRRSERRRFRSHSRWSTDMTPTETAINAIALPALYATRTFRERESFTRVYVTWFHDR